MKTPEQMVLEFHKKYGHLISACPHTSIPNNVKDLRKNLITEEYIELIDGLESDDMGEIADGIADLVYVLVGTAISYGISFDRIFAEVHNSNMTKTPSKAYEGQKYGTVNPKGPDFLRPQVMDILAYPTRQTILELRASQDRADEAAERERNSRRDLEDVQL